MFKDDFDDAIQISEYIDILYKRKVLIASVFALILAITLFVTYTTVPVYQSTAVMIIDRAQESPSLTGQRIDYESFYSQELTFNTHSRLILSKAVIQRVIKALKLDEETGANKKELEISSIKKIIKKLKHNLKLLLNIKKKEPLTDNEKLNNLINVVRGKIVVEKVEDTRLLDITVKDIDPDQSALIANSLARQYIEFDLSTRVSSSEESLEWMNGELYRMKKKLEDSEKAFFDFKKKHKIFSLVGKQKMTDQKLAEFNSNYISTKNQRLDLDTKIKEIEKNFEKSHDLSGIRSLINNKTIEDIYTKIKDLKVEYANLSNIYKSKHPKILQIKDELRKNASLLHSELQKELASLKSERDVLYSRERILKDTLSESEQDALNTSGNALEYNILQRNLNTNKHLYDTLLTKIKESDILKTSVNSNIRLVENAITPVRPILPNKKKNIMLGIIMGLAGGVLLALFLEYLDQTIRTEEDIQRYLDIPVLSVIPKADKTVDYGPTS